MHEKKKKNEKMLRIESGREIRRGDRQYLIDVLKRQESDVSGREEGAGASVCWRIITV